MSSIPPNCGQPSLVVSRSNQETDTCTECTMRYTRRTMNTLGVTRSYWVGSSNAREAEVLVYGSDWTKISVPASVSETTRSSSVAKKFRSLSVSKSKCWSCSWYRSQKFDLVRHQWSSGRFGIERSLTTLVRTLTARRRW